MTNNRLFNHCLIYALILFGGLGLAFVVPLLAISQGLATSNEIGANDNTPESTRFYIAKIGNNTTGDSWANALTDLQDALDAASSGDEIWVASGVYTPGTSETDSFNLVPGVAMYGGFDTGDVVLADRDWESNVTVLSGDIAGDDLTDSNGVVINTNNITPNNAYHVVTADGTAGTPISVRSKLDGFTITAGQANGDLFPYHGNGGGFYCDGWGIGNECSPILKNLSFSGNYASDYGGAMYNLGAVGGNSTPILTNVTFSGNSADSGGGMFNDGPGGDSSPKLTNVTFVGNSAEVYGGAMYNDGNSDGNSNPSLINVTFYRNSADSDGGGMYNFGKQGKSSPSLTNVVFSGNSAGGDGGAIYNDGDGEGDHGTSSPSLINVTFSGNIAKYGGAMFNDGTRNGESNPILTNVTFSGNWATEYGGAMSNSGRLGYSHPDVRNTILWNNKDKSGIGTISSTILNSSAKTTLSYSIVEASGGSGSGWIGGSYDDGGGNIDEDPKYITPVDPSTAPTINGNLRLKSNSPAIDKGDNSFITGVLTDLDGEPRIVDGDKNGTLTVDMGAYEYIEYRYDGYIPLIFR